METAKGKNPPPRPSYESIGTLLILQLDRIEARMRKNVGGFYFSDCGYGCRQIAQAIFHSTQRGYSAPTITQSQTPV